MLYEQKKRWKEYLDILYKEETFMENETNESNEEDKAEEIDEEDEIDPIMRVEFDKTEESEK